MLYSHDCLENPQSMAATRSHVIAHLSSVCSYDDSEEALASLVEVETKSLPNDMVRITGFIDMDPVAPYLGNMDRGARTLVLPGNTLAERIQAGLTKYGVKWRVLPGAPTRGNGQSWGNVAGAIMHHTASAIGPAPAVLWEGRPDLGPPLCNTAGEGDGTIAFVAYHPANHAGASGGKSMGPLPVTRTFNKLVWGHEIVYPGVSSMTVAQYYSAVILAKVIAEVLGVSVDHIRAHAETSITGKWDPGYANNKTIDMAAFRRDAGLAEGQASVAAIDILFHQLVHGEGNPANSAEWGWGTWKGGSNERLTVVDYLRRNNVEVRQLHVNLAGVHAKLDALARNAGVDVDEQAIANAILGSMAPLVQQAVREALGDDNDEQAQAIIEALGAKLAS